MLRFLQRRWFLLVLVLLVTGGMTWGRTGSGAQALHAGGDGTVARILSTAPTVITPIVLFLMSFTLDAGALRKAVGSPTPIFWAVAINAGLLPLAAWPLMAVQRTTDFAYGLMIAAVVPTTMAAASVWTRKAKGNDAVSLLVTLATNAACFLVVPFWVRTTTGTEVPFDGLELSLRLALTVLGPTVAGQLLRLVPACGAFATRHKVGLGVLAQSLILSLVFFSATRAGERLAIAGTGPGAGAVALVWGTCIGLHVAALLVAWWGARLLGIARPEAIGATFAASQKTLPIGILLATDKRIFGNPDLLGAGVGVPFAIFPILMFHASQLFLDDLIADRFAAGNAPQPVGTPEAAKA